MYDCKAPLSRFYYPATRRIINAFIINIIGCRVCPVVTDMNIIICRTCVMLLLI